MARTLVQENNQTIETIRSAAVLTTSYVAGTVLNLEGCNQFQLLVAFTKGSSDGARIKAEYSDDGATYYQETYFSISGSDAIHAPVYHKLEATGDVVISLPVMAKWAKVSAVAITSGTSTSMKITSIKGNI